MSEKCPSRYDADVVWKGGKWAAEASKTLFGSKKGEKLWFQKKSFPLQCRSLSTSVKGQIVTCRGSCCAPELSPELGCIFLGERWGNRAQAVVRVKMPVNEKFLLLELHSSPYQLSLAWNQSFLYLRGGRREHFTKDSLRWVRSCWVEWAGWLDLPQEDASSKICIRDTQSWGRNRRCLPEHEVCKVWELVRASWNQVVAFPTAVFFKVPQNTTTDPVRAVFPTLTKS